MRDFEDLCVQRLGGAWLGIHAGGCCWWAAPQGPAVGASVSLTSFFRRTEESSYLRHMGACGFWGQSQGVSVVGGVTVACVPHWSAVPVLES